jgi:hypothetical protein
MPTFEFTKESPVSGVGFVYKSSTSAYYFDGTTSYPLRQAATFTVTTGSGSTTMNISSVTNGAVSIGMTVVGLADTRTIVDFGTFDGVSGTVTLDSSTTWVNPTTVTGTYSFNKAGVFTATTGSGTNTINISEVVEGEVTVGDEVKGFDDGTYTTIDSFGTFNGTSGTVVLNRVVTFTNPTTITTGTLVSNFPEITVKGIVYLDGTYYVMTPLGSIYGSEINDPLTWTALNVIQSQGEPDDGVCLARQLNLIVSFGAYSTEFFYNAANPPPGSPLLPYESAFIEVGCAVAESVAQTDNSIYFMGVSKQKGRGLYRFVGTAPEYLSNPFIDRLFNADSLIGVSSFCVRIAGHLFYVIYLPDSEITLVYDDTSKQWATWTISELSATQVPTALSWSNGLVTGTKTDHGFSDGDLVIVAGVTPSGYNGTYTINVIDANIYTYDLASNPGTVTVFGTIANYVQSPLSIASYTSGNNLDIVQDSTTGFVYLLDDSTYEDNSNPIEVLIRTFKFDGGSNKKKFTSQLEIIGDKVAGNAYVRYTNDDYQTWSKYRPVNLNAQRSLLNRLGQSRRRAYEIRHHANTPLRLEALEINTSEGER